MVYDDSAEYSELADDQKVAVAITQKHLRTWSIDRELRVIFSTNCTKYFSRDRFQRTTCENCQNILQSGAFGRALRVKPVRLEKMKYIPTKYRGPVSRSWGQIHGDPGSL